MYEASIYVLMQLFLSKYVTANHHFMDFAPWTGDYMLPYAMDYCQPGPKAGTFAKYTCDVDGAGAYRYVKSLIHN